MEEFIGPRGPEFSEFLIEGDELDTGTFTYWHEACGAKLLVTRHVHMDTLARLAKEHVCD